MPVNPRAVFFDLDGVIIDSLPDIAAALNGALAEYGFPALGIETIKSFVGYGARHLLARAFAHAGTMAGKTAPEPGKSGFEELYAWYIPYYRDHSIEKTTLYPGVRALLDALNRRGIPLAVVSNKPRPVTLTVLEKLDIARYFASVVGPEQLERIKPDPEGLALALKEINEGRKNAPNGGAEPPILPGETLMVGDSGTDIQAGKAFGAKTCAITGGYGDTGELLAQGADITLAGAGALAEVLA
jgi:phosphoglycolate phosphatase